MVTAGAEVAAARARPDQPGRLALLDQPVHRDQRAILAMPASRGQPVRPGRAQAR